MTNTAAATCHPSVINASAVVTRGLLAVQRSQISVGRVEAWVSHRRFVRSGPNGVPIDRNQLHKIGSSGMVARGLGGEKVALPTGIVSFLFTDIEGSSGKWDSDAEAMRGAVLRHDELLQRAIETKGGVVIKKMGDGMMAAFASPAAALSAAVAAQSSISTTEWGPAVEPFAVRMGIHTGPASPDDGDYLGPSVNRAARIEAAGHGGQILVSAATRDLIGELDGVEFNDLGQHQLRGLSRPERIYQVTRVGSPRAFPALRTESTPSNLPSRITSLIGRRSELDQLSSLLTSNRLVTVTGPGGAGKTTLAVEAARLQSEDRPAGVWLFELAAISDGTLIPSEMLGVLRRPTPADRSPLEAVAEALASQHALLVFDNCEHLVDDVADIVSTVLRRSDDVRVLATSREPLGVRGEQVWAIPTMTQPDETDPAAVRASDAGTLFIERASQADQHFTLTDDNAHAVASICRRLDGLPLAIELAAARVRSMSPAEIDRRLEDRFGLLRSRDRDRLPHHQTLRESVGWSYDLLEPATQDRYQRLSIFVGGFDLEAAEAVTDATVIDDLDTLISQSLLIADRGDPTRYRMLETIRQYGVERLGEAGTELEARRAHLDWLATLVKEGGRELEGRHQAAWLRRFRREIDNIRAALDWAREHDPATGVAIMASLSRFFWLYGTEGDATAMKESTSFLREGYDWASSLLDAAGDDLVPKMRARLQMAIGGLLCIRAGRFKEAIDRLDDAARYFEAEGDARSLGWVTFYRACAGVGVDDTRHQTLELFRRSTELHTEAEDRFGELMGNLLLGFFNIGTDDDDARKRLSWVHKATAATRIPALVAHGADAAAQLDASLGEVTDATRRHAAESLLTFRAIGNYACVRHALFAAASVLAAQGDVDDAARAYGVADAIRDRLSMAPAPYETRDWMIASIAGDSFGRETWNRARAEGATFQPDEGIDWVVEQLGVDQAELVNSDI